MLINPRGSLLEEVFDDFYLEQASPVDLTPPSSALLSISKTSSHHSSVHLSSTSSSHKKRIQTPSLHSAGKHRYRRPLCVCLRLILCTVSQRERVHPTAVASTVRPPQVANLVNTAGSTRRTPSQKLVRTHSRK